MPSLSAGSTSTQTFTWKANKCGNVKVKAIADATNALDESNEGNNERTETVNIICLYLEKIWITGPDEIKAGETLQWQAYGSYSDGTQKVLTNQVSWDVVTSDILQNMGNGKFKGLKGGEATLKIDYEGKSASKKVTVIEKENQPPKASFTYEKDGLTVRFTSTSSDPDGEIKRYQWLFGDELGTTQKNPEHTYCSEGTYKVILIVWDDKGATNSCSNDITVTEPKVSIKVTVNNINNYPLPGCGGEITVKAHKNIHDNPIAEGSASYYGGEKDLTITLNVPTKKAKSITVWQTPKIKDGVQEYWGAMAITPEKKNEYNFVRHTPRITNVTINGKSPYNELIDLNSPGWQTFYVQVTNPQVVNRKVKVEAFLDRDEKTPWDFNSNDLYEVAPKESKEFSFFYNKEQTEGIWRFRVVVGMYSLDNKYVVTDQHAWYLVVSKKQIIQARSLQVFANYHLTDNMCKDSKKDFENRLRQALSHYFEDIGKTLTKGIAESYDPIVGKLIGTAFGTDDPVKSGVKALCKCADSGFEALNYQLIQDKFEHCKIKKHLLNLNQYACDEEDAWKARDIQKLNKALIDEGKQLSYIIGFTYAFSSGQVPLADLPRGTSAQKVKNEMHEISEDMRGEWKLVAYRYNDLNGLDRSYKDFMYKTKMPSGEDCATKIITVYPPTAIFDTGAPSNPYPSIAGTHTGTITPNQTITVNKLYTYPCAGTGGHTESIELYDENGNLIASGNWNGYQQGDWHNITFDLSLIHI